MGCDCTKRLKMCFLEANLFFWAGERCTLPFKTLRTTSQILKIQSLEQCFKTSFFSLGEQQEDFSICKMGKWAFKLGREVFLLLRFRSHGQMSCISSFHFLFIPFSTSHERPFGLEVWEQENRDDATKRYVCWFRACLSVLGWEKHPNKIDSDISPSCDGEERG